MSLSEQDLPWLLKRVTLPDNDKGRISRGTGLGLSQVKTAELILKVDHSTKDIAEEGINPWEG